MTTTSRTLCLCMFLLLFTQLPLSPAPAQHISQHTSEQTQGTVQLLIIVSPQYAQDNDITDALHYYMTAVQDDLGWNSTIHPVTPEENDYRLIDTVIETYYTTDHLLACLMVGEDLDTPLAGDSDYLEQPSTIPWATIGGPTAYETTTNGILCTPYNVSICVSLLYPTHALSYQTKKTDLITALTRFATQRHHDISAPAAVYESSALATTSTQLYQNLSQHHPITYQEDPTNTDLQQSLTQPYAFYMIHGHSTPAGTELAAPTHTWFQAHTLDHLQTPFFCADGCYTAGWWSDQPDNNHLDQSSDAPWYGAEIFTSPTLQAIALGLLSQNGFPAPVSFIENVMPRLLAGKTLAEATVGTCTIGDSIIIGDPTFHYTA